MIKVIFDINSINDSSALNMIDEVMICESVKVNEDGLLLMGHIDGNIGVLLEWVKEIKGA